MPRGVQKTDEEKLQAIDNQITEMEDRKAKIQNTINRLNAKRKEVLQNVHNKKLEELAKVLESSGKTPDDILEMLKD